MRTAEQLVQDNVHPTIIVDGYRKAANKALKTLDMIAIKIPPTDRKWLIKIAKTSMASKLISNDSGKLWKLTVDGLLSVIEKVGEEKYKVDIDDVKVRRSLAQA